MRVFVGTDHAGLEFKDHLKEALTGAGHEPVDCGAFEYDPQDDYPVFILPAALAVAAEPGSLGVVLGGSGNGEQIAANLVPSVRAALGWSVETAVLARQHNDATVIGVGARQHSLEEATAIVDAFLAEPFSGDERHARRIAMLTRFAETGQLPATS